jgi:hypothetical protein
MEYLLLVYGEEANWTKLSKAKTDAMHGDYMKFGKNHASIIRGGNALMPVAEAKTVRVRGGKASTTDGPFAETKEQLGGYYLVEAQSLEEALKAAAQIPGARDGSIEVRPIMKIE